MSSTCCLPQFHFLWSERSYSIGCEEQIMSLRFMRNFFSSSLLGMNILLIPFYPALPARAAVLFKIHPTLVLRPRRFSEKVGVNKENA